jgi:DNA repair protein RadC
MPEQDILSDFLNEDLYKKIQDKATQQANTFDLSDDDKYSDFINSLPRSYKDNKLKGSSEDDKYSFGQNTARGAEAGVKKLGIGSIEAIAQGVKQHSGQLDEENFLQTYPQTEQQRQDELSTRKDLYENYLKDDKDLQGLADQSGIASDLQKNLLRQDAKNYKQNGKPISDPTFYDDQIKSKGQEFLKVMTIRDGVERQSRAKEIRADLADLNFRKKAIEEYGDLTTAWNNLNAKYKDTSTVADRMLQYADEVELSIPNYDENSVGGFIGNVAATALPQLVMIAASPFTAGTTGAIGMTYLAGMGVSSAGMGMREYRQHQEERGLPVDRGTMLGVGVLNGGFEFLFERFRLPRWMPVNAFFKKSVQEVVENGVSKGTADIWIDVASRLTKKNYGKILKEMVKQGNEEGLEELFTEIAQTLVNNSYKDEEDRTKGADFIKAVMMAYAGGALAGSFLGAAKVPVENYMQRRTRKENGGITIAGVKGKQHGVEVLNFSKDAALIINPDGSQEVVPTSDVEYSEFIPQNEWNKFNTAFQRSEVEGRKEAEAMQAQAEQQRTQQQFTQIADDIAHEDGNVVAVALDEAREDIAYIKKGAYTVLDDGSIKFTDQDQPLIAFKADGSKVMVSPKEIWGGMVATKEEFINSNVQFQQQQKNPPKPDVATSPETANILQKIEAGMSVTTENGMFVIGNIQGVDDGFVLVNNYTNDGKETQIEMSVEEALNLFEPAIKANESPVVPQQDGKTPAQATNVSAPADQQQPEAPQIPMTKDGNVDFDNIQEPDMFAAGLQQEFAEDAPDVFEGLMQEAEDKLKAADKKKNAIEKARARKQAQAEIEKLKKVQAILTSQNNEQNPQDQAAVPGGEVQPAVQGTPQKPAQAQGLQAEAQPGTDKAAPDQGGVEADKIKLDPDLANLDPDLIAARNGDKEAQKSFEDYGLEWEQTTTYRFVGQSEVDVLLSNNKVESKRFTDAGIDVTTSPKVTTAASNEYRVTFKESFDVNNGLGKVRIKSKEEGDHNLEKGRGYDINDVTKIERIDENGNVVETVYEQSSTQESKGNTTPDNVVDNQPEQNIIEQLTEQVKTANAELKELQSRKDLPADQHKRFVDAKKKQVSILKKALKSAKLKGKMPMSKEQDWVSQNEFWNPLHIVYEYFALGGRVHPQVIIDMYKGDAKGELNMNKFIVSKDTGLTLSELSKKLWEDNEHLGFGDDDYANAIEEALNSSPDPSKQFTHPQHFAKSLYEAFNKENNDDGLSWEERNAIEQAKVEQEMRQQEELLQEELFYEAMKHLENNGQLITDEEYNSLFLTPEYQDNGQQEDEARGIEATPQQPSGTPDEADGPRQNDGNAEPQNSLQAEEPTARQRQVVDQLQSEVKQAQNKYERTKKAYDKSKPKTQIDAFSDAIPGSDVIDFGDGEMLAQFVKDAERNLKAAEANLKEAEQMLAELEKSLDNQSDNQADMFDGEQQQQQDPIGIDNQIDDALQGQSEEQIKQVEDKAKYATDNVERITKINGKNVYDVSVLFNDGIMQRWELRYNLKRTGKNTDQKYYYPVQYANIEYKPEATNTNQQEPAKQTAKPKTAAEMIFGDEQNTPQKIEDFGEEIKGAKKMTWKPVESTPEGIASMPLSKSFPRPDFVQLVKDGALTEDGALFLMFFYDSIPTKPKKAYKLKRWVETVQNAIDTFNKVLGTPEETSELINKFINTPQYRNTAIEFKWHSDVKKALGFPLEDVKTGQYQIKKFITTASKEDADAKPKFTIVKGRYIIKDFDTLQEAADGIKELIKNNKSSSKDVKLNIYQDAKTKKYFIGRKGAVGVVRIMEGIETLKEAREIFKEQAATLQQMWKDMKVKPEERRAKNRKRVGVDYRKGKDVTPEQFTETFGFRGTQFGNWVNNNERQQALNDAYDALMDLATALNIPTRVISLGGELGMAFGARGSGKASAHYESGEVVINMTKTKGAGSLAHEWWHALDSYFSRKRGKKLGFLTQKPIQGYRVDENTKKAVPDERIRKEMADAFSDVVDAIRNSGLPKRSKSLDRTRSDVYWSDIIEMSARSFENFIIEKLGADGESNDYLANFKEIGEWIETGAFGEDTFPYPNKEETPAINDAFQQFFDTIETNVDENGVTLLNEEAATYLKENGVYQTDGQKRRFSEEISYVSERANDDTPESDKLQREAGYDAKADDGEITYLERQLSELKGFTLIGDKLTGRPTIKSPKDVAFLFKNLESASMENAFAVFHNKDGSYKVMYLSTGHTSAALVDMKLVVAAAKELGASAVTFAHNHPSGSITPSKEDIIIHKKLKDAMSIIGIETNESVIINIDTGKFGVFSTNNANVQETDNNQEGVEPQVFQFDRQKLYVPSNSKTIIKDSRSVAEFLSKMKRGTTPKIGVLILGRNNSINKYLMLDETVNNKELISEILPLVGKHGDFVILHSNEQIDRYSVRELQNALKNIGSELLDVITVDQGKDVLDAYRSWSDKGWMEDPATYNSDGIAVAEPSSKELLQDQIQKLEKGIENLRKERNAKLNEFNKRNGLFGDTNTSPLQNLFEVETDFSKENMDNITRPLDEQIKTAKKRLAELREKLNNAGDDGQMTLFEPDAAYNKLPATLTINGTERPTQNSNGQPIATTKEGVRNFWEETDVIITELENTGNEFIKWLDLVREIEGENVKIKFDENGYFTSEESEFDDYKYDGRDYKDFQFAKTKQETEYEKFNNKLKDLSDKLGLELSNPYGDSWYLSTEDGTKTISFRDHNIANSTLRHHEAIYPVYYSNEIYKSDINKAIEWLNQPITDIRFSAAINPTTGFYSPTEAALNAIKQDKGTPEQMKAMLLKNGAKQAELDWMDYDGAFADKKSITKADIQQWIDQNRIEVEEVVKGIKTDPNIKTWTDWAKKEYPNATDIEVKDVSLTESQRMYDIYVDGKREIKGGSGVWFPNMTNDTKHSQYQLPGGRNYKEFVLTMPNQIEPYKPDDVHFTEEGGGTAVVWVRANERQLKNERILFIEEIQSKRGQDGREEGFRTDKLPDNVKIKEVGGNWQVIVDGRLKGEYKTEQRAKETAMADFGGVPDMPFQKTDQWVNLAMRRMVRYAAENGFDRIAWTSGEIQDGRYDLSKQVDSIEVENKENGIRYIKIYPKGESYNSFDIDKNGVVIKHAQWEGKRLDEIVGKETADKIMNNSGTPISTKNSELFILKGDNLKIDSPGMKAFYDNIVPKAASKLAKPFGGKVEMIDLDLNDDVLDLDLVNEAILSIPEDGIVKVQSMPISPQMREAAMEKGFPLFLITGARGARKLDAAARKANANNEDAAYYEGDRRFDNLQLAKYMEEGAATDAATIKRATGWERGADKKWRYETAYDPDFTPFFIAQLEHDGKQTKNGRMEAHDFLDEVIGKNSEVLKAYPALKTITVKMVVKPGISMSGSYNGIDIVINAPNLESARRVLVHEIQHGIQIEEGFERGSNYEVSGKLSQEHLKKAQDALSKYVYENDTKTEAELKQDKEYNKLLEDVKIAQLEVDNPNINYNKSAGEAEARNAEGRINLTPEQRRNMLLVDTEDVARGDMIFLQNVLGGSDESQLATPTAKRKVIELLEKRKTSLNRAVIVNKQSDLPIEVKKKIGKGVSVRGMLYSGKTYYVLENITNAGDVVRVWMHEQGVHYGLLQLIPNEDERIAFLNRVFDEIGLDAIGKVVDFEVYDKDMPKHLLAEEYMAHLVDKKLNGRQLSISQQNVWQQFIHYINTFINKVIGDNTVRITENDVLEVAKAAIQLNLQGNETQEIENNKHRRRRIVAAALQGASVNAERTRRPSTTQQNKNSKPEILFSKVAKTKEETPTQDLFDYKRATNKPLALSLKNAEIFWDVHKRWEVLRDQIIARDGKVPEWADPYQHVTLLTSINQHEIDTYNKDIYEPLIKTIAKISEKSNLEQEQVEKYMIFKHAPERNKLIRSRKPNSKGDEVYAGSIDGVLLTDEYATEQAERYEQLIGEELVNELWENINAATEFSLRKHRDSGFMLDADYQNIVKQYQYYVPLRGFADTTPDQMFDYLEDSDKRDGFQNPVKKAEGRTSEADSPLVYIHAMAETAIMYGNKNVLKQKALAMVRLNRDDMRDLFDMRQVWMVDTGQVDENNEPIMREAVWEGENVYYIEDFDTETGDIIKSLAGKADKLKEEGRISYQQNFEHYRRNTTERAEQHHIIVHEAGRKYVVVMKDPQLALSINGRTMARIPRTGIEFVDKGLQYPAQATRTMSMLLTSKNPAFIPVNFIRDIGYASMAHGIKDSGDVVMFLKNISRATAAIHRYERGTADPKNNADDAMFERFLKAGGRTGYAHTNNIEAHRKMTKKQIKRLLGKNSKLDKLAYNNVTKFANTSLDYLNALSEDTARFSTFMVSKSKGRTDSMAALDAKNITVNFNQKGQVAPLLGMGYAFANASIQGGVNMTRMAIKHPKAFAKAGGLFVALGFAIAEMMRLAMPDDEKEEYYGINRYIRDNYMVLPNPAWIWGSGKDKYVSIPLPHGFRAFYSVGQVVSDMIHGAEEPMSGFVRLLDNVTSTFSPWDLTGFVNNDKEATIRPLVFTWYMPIFDITNNEDFAGRRVFNEMFTPTLEDRVPDSEKGLKSTNPFLVEMAKKLNKAAGGDENRPAKYVFNKKTGQFEIDGFRNMFDINPAKVEHLLEGYTGGAGVFLNQSIKTMYSAIMIASGNKEEEIETRDVPVLNRLYRTNYKSQDVSDYYDMMRNTSYYKYIKKLEGGTFQSDERVERDLIFITRLNKKVKQLEKEIEQQTNEKLRRELTTKKNEYISEQMRNHNKMNDGK